VYTSPKVPGWVKGPRPQAAGREVDRRHSHREKASGKSLRQQLYKDGILTGWIYPGRADKLTRLHIVSHFLQMVEYGFQRAARTR